MYYRLDSEDIEPLHQGGTQHCHEPLWKRNDPERIRHIRGILLEDDPETKKVILFYLYNQKASLPLQFGILKQFLGVCP